MSHWQPELAGQNDLHEIGAATVGHHTWHEPASTLPGVGAEPRSVACLTPQPTADEWAEETLEELAARIQEAHVAVSRASAAVVAFAIRAGELLLKARERVPAGSWGAWIECNCQFSARTGQDYLRIARAFHEGLIDPQQHAADAASLRQVLAMLRKDRGARSTGGEAQEATANPWADWPVELVPHLISWDKTRRRFVAQTKRLSDLELAHAHPKSRERFRKLVCDTIADIWNYGPRRRAHAAQPLAAVLAQDGP